MQSVFVCKHKELWEICLLAYKNTAYCILWAVSVGPNDNNIKLFIYTF